MRNACEAVYDLLYPKVASLAKTEFKPELEPRQQNNDLRSLLDILNFNKGVTNPLFDRIHKIAISWAELNLEIFKKQIINERDLQTHQK